MSASDANLPPLEHLPALVNDDPALVRRGRFLSVTFLVAVGEIGWLVRVREGRIDAVTRAPAMMADFRFALRAPADAWARFWQPVPEPGWQDLFALQRRKLLTMEGDLQPLMANLLYIKDVLASPRRLHGGAAR
ncbi:MAG TPA: hypothetical protein VMB81_16160 [Candidatus Sulfotelmatobacter sp.]|nr:hypothetical protein [Candidatus Sulfotelmatobacter sp.]